MLRQAIQVPWLIKLSCLSEWQRITARCTKEKIGVWQLTWWDRRWIPRIFCDRRLERPIPVWCWVAWPGRMWLSRWRALVGWLPPPLSTHWWAFCRMTWWLPVSTRPTWWREGPGKARETGCIARTQSRWSPPRPGKSKAFPHLSTSWQTGLQGNKSRVSKWHLECCINRLLKRIRHKQSGTGRESLICKLRLFKRVDGGLSSGFFFLFTPYHNIWSKDPDFAPDRLIIIQGFFDILKKNSIPPSKKRT